MEYKLGKFILEKRKEKRMSLRELASRAEISATYLSDIENGRKEYDVSKNVLVKIKNALELNEIDTETLYSLAKESTNGVPVDVIETINEYEELVPFKDLIYEIRGKQVMLDSDLAKLYQVETKRINEAVKNNQDKFPERFSFVLTNEELGDLRSKFSTSSLIAHGGRRYAIRVFTEQGVAMLATILKSKVATQVSIAIMDAFVLMRKYLSNNLIEHQNLYDLVLEDHHRINKLEDTFQKFEEKKKVHEIYFDGQIYDAYSKILDIFSKAKKEIIIIDNYADKTLLDIIKELNVKVTIITKKNNLLKDHIIEKYYKEYHNLTVKYDNTFHDRYFILDKSMVYHCGASINRIGYKTFSITLVGDLDIVIC